MAAQSSGGYLDLFLQVADLPAGMTMPPSGNWVASPPASPAGPDPAAAPATA